MDNEQLLMQLGKFDFLARTPGLGARVPVERDDLRRLLAESEAYAKLRAEIAGAPVVAVTECNQIPGASDFDAGDLHAAEQQFKPGERVALLRLPAGEGRE